MELEPSVIPLAPLGPRFGFITSLGNQNSSCANVFTRTQDETAPTVNLLLMRPMSNDFVLLLFRDRSDFPQRTPPCISVFDRYYGSASDFCEF